MGLRNAAGGFLSHLVAVRKVSIDPLPMERICLDPRLVHDAVAHCSWAEGRRCLANPNTSGAGAATWSVLLVSPRRVHKDVIRPHTPDYADPTSTITLPSLPFDSISCMRWSPVSPDQLMVSSWDTTVRLYDIGDVPYNSGGRTSEMRAKFDHRAAVPTCA
ncbi:hypothetical protein BKA70DRAFT_1539831 [Coprinopsis sp. MPI-PUGE-AT-0042]|nr:hypothetical protein BKA70DRAFT_1539831 [Coprinopsis sp. MPI-PUGE-AT-0042]